MITVMKFKKHSDHLSSAKLLITMISGVVLSISSCAPDPTLQQQMEQDILTAAETRKPGDSAGPQQGRGSRAWGYGGF